MSDIEKNEDENLCDVAFKFEPNSVTHVMILSEKRYAELQRKAVWYDRVHEPKEYDFTEMNDVGLLINEIILCRHMIAEFSDAANVMPKELAEMRSEEKKLADYLHDAETESGVVRPQGMTDVDAILFMYNNLLIGVIRGDYAVIDPRELAELRKDKERLEKIRVEVLKIIHDAKNSGAYPAFCLNERVRTCEEILSLIDAAIEEGKS